jgi:uncharacterized protein (TIGR00369 family)
MTSSKKTPADAERFLKALQSVPYAELLGIKVKEVSAGSATLFFKIRKEHLQNHGVVHGGAIASLIDTAMAFAVISVLPPSERVSTVDLTVSYLQPLTEGTIWTTAQVLRSGRRLIRVSANVFDDARNLAATALSTYVRL